MHRTENVPQFLYSREFSGLVAPQGVQTLGPILLSTSHPSNSEAYLSCWLVGLLGSREGGY